MRQRLTTAANALAVFAGVLILWQLVLWIFNVQPYMLPSPSAVAKAIGKRFPSLISSTAITAEESVGGLIASIIVGVIVALTYVSAIDDPGRFRSSKIVGAHFGLTAKRNQSGEITSLIAAARNSSSTLSSFRKSSSVDPW